MFVIEVRFAGMEKEDQVNDVSQARFLCIKNLLLFFFPFCYFFKFYSFTENIRIGFNFLAIWTGLLERFCADYFTCSHFSPLQNIVLITNNHRVQKDVGYKMIIPWKYIVKFPIQFYCFQIPQLHWNDPQPSRVLHH